MRITPFPYEPPFDRPASPTWMVPLGRLEGTLVSALQGLPASTLLAALAEQSARMARALVQDLLVRLALARGALAGLLPYPFLTCSVPAVTALQYGQWRCRHV